MKYLALLLTIIAMNFQAILFAQNEEPYENAVSADYQINKYDPEPDAPAVVVFDKAETRFYDTERGFTYIMTRRVRIKIRSEIGLKYAEVEIPTYNSNNITESILSLSAFSYNVTNDKMVKVDLNPENKHKEKKENNWELTKFAIPNAQVGSIIEYEYKIESNYLFSIRDWTFQWDVPVLYSGCKLFMIPFYTYQFYLQGASKFDVYSSKESHDKRNSFGIEYSELIYTFGMKNIPSFKNEGYITSKSDYLMKIDFQLAKIIYPDGRKEDVISTWPQLKKDLLSDENFGKYIKAAQNKADKILNIKSLSTLEPTTRIDSIISFVKNNYNWDGDYSMNTYKKLSKFIETKRGSSAEINLFTIGLLNAVGIISHPVIISTRAHGKIRTNYPYYDNFNNVLIYCETPTGASIKDATDILLENNKLPTDCLNELGLLVKDDKNEEWVKLNTNGNSRIRTNLFSSIENNSIISKISVSATEYDGLFLREKFGIDKEKVLKHISSENDAVVDSSLVIKNMENAKNPYVLNYTVSNKLQKAADCIYIQPFLREVISENPFKLANRKHPIDMVYPQNREFIASIGIPAGYKVDFLPANKNSKNSYFEYNYSTQILEDRLVVFLNYKLFKHIYQPEDYLLLKSFYKDVVEIGNDRIILKKL